MENPSLLAINEFHGTNIGMKILRSAWLLVQEFSALFAGENIVSFVDWLGADHKLRNIAQWTARFFNDKMTVHDGASVEEIGRQGGVTTLGGITLNVAVAEETFFWRFLIAASQTNDDDGNVRHTARVASPGECPVSEADF